MKTNIFQLTKKCPYSCFKCEIPPANSKTEILEIINESKKNTLNIFFNITIDNNDLHEIINLIKEKKQKLGFFYNGLPKEVYLQHNPNMIAFPMFSTMPEKHDQFIGKLDFYKMISAMNALPKEIKKPIVFFVSKENISETTELAGLTLSLNTKIYLQPIKFYSEEDFDKEIMLYLRRIGKNKKITLLKPQPTKSHCTAWDPSTNLFKILFKKIRNI